MAEQDLFEWWGSLPAFDQELIDHTARVFLEGMNQGNPLSPSWKTLVAGAAGQILQLGDGRRSRLWNYRRGAHAVLVDTGLLRMEELDNGGS